MTTETETGAILSQAKEHWSRQKLEGVRTDFQAFPGQRPGSSLWPPEPTHVCCFQPSRSFVLVCCSGHRTNAPTSSTARLSSPGNERPLRVGGEPSPRVCLLYAGVRAWKSPPGQTPTGPNPVFLPFTSLVGSAAGEAIS